MVSENVLIKVVTVERLSDNVIFSDLVILEVLIVSSDKAIESKINSSKFVAVRACQ